MNRSELEVGHEIPEFSRTTGLHNWNRFAAVNDEFVDIHMDDEAGRTAGYPGAFGMGRLQHSYLHTLLDTWLGHEHRIVKLAAQFRGPNVRGLVKARGRITAVTRDEGETLVDLDVWIEDGEGKVLAPGTATVAIADAPA